MPTTFSKPTSQETTIKRTYDEPIPFVPQADKTNVQKPRDIKIPLRQNPAVATSTKVEKIFQEFVENSPEAFCRWRCDTAEYIKGAGITAPAAKVLAAQQLLGQSHKTTWETTISAIVEGGAVTTDEEVQEIFEAFALNFMDATARRKQKRYMSSGSIQKPKGWSSRQVASRLSTLNRYLQYLPGTAAEFDEEEMKDMLVDLHSPVYQHLLARANYSVEDNSYLKLTTYLQNLSLIEESFNKNKAQGNSESKHVQKAGKSFKKKSKLGKNQCRKHPHHEHTWADCWANPKNKDKKPAFKAGKVKEKAEARNADAMDTDSEADMDQAITVLAIEDEVRNEPAVTPSVQPKYSTHTNLMSVSHTTVNIGRAKHSGLNNYNSTVYNKRKNY